MSRLSIETPGRAQTVLDGLHRDMDRRINASAHGLCPVDMSLNYLRLCHAQTCGKCVPCCIGLGQLENLIEQVLDEDATMETIDTIERTARVIADSAGCAIGYEGAHMVLKGIRGFREDYEEHVLHGRCISALTFPVPCVSACPAHVDVPGYVALVNEGRYEEAVSLIRKDNPFPSSCAYVCEHPCEGHCRRAMVDDAINICGLKRFAVDNAKPQPAKILHEPTGINVITDVSIGKDVSMEDIQKSFDAVYISIGAHNDKKLGIEGEDAINVVSAVGLLRRIGEGDAPDFTGKKICVIGGGNVSMDATRTARRLGAESVTCVYRRRVDDMTALAEEIEEAMAEGCQILPLQAPARIEKDEEGKVAALWTTPQIIGPYGKDGRPKPISADVPEFRIECDYVIVAIGQAIDARPFESIGIKTFKGMIQAEDTSSVADVDNVFAGGDAVSGPSTVIRAVAAGKVAAANIDAYLGFDHKISTDIVVPPANLSNAPPAVA